MQKGKKYKNPPLTDIICIINYSTITQIKGIKKEAANNFYNLIQEVFPIISYKVNNELKLEFDPINVEPKNSNTFQSLTWIFQNKDKTKDVELTPNFMKLHYRNGVYTHFRDFLEDILLLINALKTYSPSNIKMLSLRYINQFNNINENNADNILNPKLFNNIVEDFEDEKLIQVLSNLNLKKDKYLLTFQYGLFNPNFPDSNFKKDFILDYDCKLNNIKSLDDIKEELKKMNKFIFEKFEYSLTEEYKNQMGEEL